MDPQPSAAVTEAFVRWYEEGADLPRPTSGQLGPGLKTAISDLEVENVAEEGMLWSIRYPLSDGVTYEHIEHDAAGNEILRETRDSLIVATTRPETLLGDTAVMVHPEDRRYTALIGKTRDIAADRTPGRSDQRHLRRSRIRQCWQGRHVSPSARLQRTLKLVCDTNYQRSKCLDDAARILLR